MERTLIGTGIGAKARVLTSVSAFALIAAFSAQAFAQEAVEPEPAAAVVAEPQTAALSEEPQTAALQEAAAPEEIVVTGSRIVRDGYEAPTPVSVLGAAELQTMAVTNIADAVNRLPAFGRPTSTNNSAASDVTAGINNLNLRGLAAIRTLVLLDGKRIVGSTLAGFNNNGSAVDINVIPNGLVSRVDVVTGGASAVYGSDALAGVVNFVLDKEFVGVKGQVQGGITTYGDDENYAAEFTAGVAFGGGKGHFLISAENAYNNGILHNDRPWTDHSYSIIVNPTYSATNGQPQYITIKDSGLATATRGGLIVTCGGFTPASGLCPIRGTQFLAGGAPSKFNFGSIVSGNLMSGGDWRVSRIDQDSTLSISLQRTTVYSRASYDVTDGINAFAEVGWSYGHAVSPYGVPFFHLNSVTVKADNAFIPASVRAAMTAAGLTSFSLGTVNGDEPPFAANNGRTFRRLVTGLDGAFGAMDTDWTWGVSFERSTTHVSTNIPNDEITANYGFASDAVISPTTGQIVCRSLAVNPTCVPYNVMGIGVNTQAALNYISAKGHSTIILAQNVWEGSIAGEPFSSWAGPVSVALSAEHRTESVNSTATPIDVARGFFAGNFTASVGKYSVTEGAVETVVPLAKDEPWARSLDLNAAVRATNYSTSGYVTTWKVGGTYKPIDDVTFRATRSRDIRAPNLGDLFSAGRSGTGAVTEAVPGQGLVTVVAVTRVQGNPNLLPEKANTTGLGMVVQPSFLPGFGASVDFYNIDISDAIVSLSAQVYTDRCLAGDTVLCSFIQRGTDGRINFVAVQPANVLTQKERGVDFEASYNFDLADVVGSLDGNFSLRGMATYIDTLKTIDVSSVVEGAGVSADGAGLGATGLFAPRWKYMISATYKLDAFAGTITARGTSPGKYNNAMIYCTTGCPTSTPLAPTFGTPNHTPGTLIFDLSLNYKVFEDTSEVFFVVQNMLNRAPPFIAASLNNGYYSGQGNAEFDRIGRVFRAGLRFKM